MVTVRSVLPEDANQLSLIEESCFTIPWSINNMKESINNKNYYFYGAEISGVLVGYIGMIVILDEADITNVAVLPSHRGAHIGTQLLDHLKSCARAMGISSIHLEVRGSNACGIHVYEQQGFLIMGRRKDYYHNPKEDAIIMAVNLD